MNILNDPTTRLKYSFLWHNLYFDVLWYQTNSTNSTYHYKFICTYYAITTYYIIGQNSIVPFWEVKNPVWDSRLYGWLRISICFERKVRNLTKIIFRRRITDEISFDQCVISLKSNLRIDKSVVSVPYQNAIKETTQLLTKEFTLLSKIFSWKSKNFTTSIF